MLQENRVAEIRASVQILQLPVRFQVKLKYFRDSGAREGTGVVPGAASQREAAKKWTLQDSHYAKGTFLKLTPELSQNGLSLLG